MLSLKDECSFRFFNFFESPVSLNFSIFSLFLVNDPQALQGNPGCRKCILGIILSPANKKLFTISFILYLRNKVSPDRRILMKGVFNLKLLNNGLVSHSLINLDFLRSRTAYPIR